MDVPSILALLPPAPGHLAVVLCDGEAPSADLLRTCLAGADLFVCADGAGRPYDRLPRLPDLVLGDFDTLGSPPPDGAVRFVHDPDQDTTDGEKAVARAATAGCGRVLLLGAGGGHLDHALANLALPERFAHACDVVLVNDHGVTRRLPPAEIWSLDLPLGTLLSLSPCGGRAKGVRLDGVRWPLRGADLEWGGPVAVSNLVTAPPVRLRCDAGSLLVTVRADAPPEAAP